jgi:hypothetical protein
MLNESILKAFEQTNGKVVLGSTTVELIKIPDLKVDVNKS